MADGKQSAWGLYWGMWRPARERQSVSRRQFRVCLLGQAIVLVVAALLLLAWVELAEQPLLVAAGVVGLFYLVSLVPLALLTARRMRTIGKSPAWALLLLVVGVGLLVLAFSPALSLMFFDRPQTVYGPPVPINEIQDVYGPPTNEITTVYGPPPSQS